jgi:hypothetical protein
MATCCIALLLKHHPCMVYPLHALAHNPWSDPKLTKNNNFAFLVPDTKLDRSWMWPHQFRFSVFELLTRYLHRSLAQSSSCNHASFAGPTNIWLNCCVLAWRKDCSRWTPFHHRYCEGKKWPVNYLRILLKLFRFRPITGMYLNIIGIIFLSLYVLFKSFKILHRYRNLNIQFFATILWLSKLHAWAWSWFWCWNSLVIIDY